MSDVESTVQTLVARFREIEDGIRGLPIHNPALEVEAIGFQSVDGGLLGGLVSPWFINLMFLPDPAEAWDASRVGGKRSVVVPAGETVMDLGGDEVLGMYLSRPVRSPVTGVRSQGSARRMAEAAVEKALTPPPPPEPEEGGKAEGASMGRRALLTGKFKGASGS